MMTVRATLLNNAREQLTNDTDKKRAARVLYTPTKS